MGYTRRKMKTSRRVKRTKTKNTRKQKRNRTFRKSRRVNRGGTRKRSRGAMEDNWQEDIQTAKHKFEQDAIDREKANKTDKKTEKNIKRGRYHTPLGKGSKSIIWDQTDQLEITARQNRFMDDINAETEGENGDLEDSPPSFGGKKKRTTKKK